MFPTLRNWVFCLSRLFKVVKDSHHEEEEEEERKLTSF
jgi:hypothetical protein